MRENRPDKPQGVGSGLRSRPCVGENPGRGFVEDRGARCYKPLVSRGAGADLKSETTVCAGAVRRRIERLSLIAMATVFELVLFVLDAAFPKPVPWIKVGL